MGLAERRAIAAFQKDRYPDLKKKIDEAAKLPVEIDVDWNAIAKEGEADNYEKGIANFFFVPLANALGQICADEMGRDAVKDGLKGVKVNYTSGSLETELQGKVLLLKGDPNWSSSIDVQEQTRKIVQTLEKAL